jgi:hypothetical protein
MLTFVSMTPLSKAVIPTNVGTPLPFVARSWLLTFVSMTPLSKAVIPTNVGTPLPSPPKAGC